MAQYSSLEPGVLEAILHGPMFGQENEELEERVQQPWIKRAKNALRNKTVEPFRKGARSAGQHLSEPIGIVREVASELNQAIRQTTWYDPRTYGEASLYLATLPVREWNEPIGRTTIINGGIGEGVRLAFGLPVYFATGNGFAYLLARGGGGLSGHVATGLSYPVSRHYLQREDETVTDFHIKLGEFKAKEAQLLGRAYNWSIGLAFTATSVALMEFTKVPDPLAIYAVMPSKWARYGLFSRRMYERIDERRLAENAVRDVAGPAPTEFHGTAEVAWQMAMARGREVTERYHVDQTELIQRVFPTGQRTPEVKGINYGTVEPEFSEMAAAEEVYRKRGLDVRILNPRMEISVGDPKATNAARTIRAQHHEAQMTAYMSSINILRLPFL